MNTIDCIKTHRSVRKFRNEQIKDDELIQILEADAWREDAWLMIQRRSDLHFFMITKRPERIVQCLPDDWGDGYENVTICCTMENQRRVDERLPLYRELPIRHKSIICEPLLEAIDFHNELGTWCEQVTVGGESGRDARVCDYDWMLKIREQCIKSNVAFHFKQTRAHSARMADCITYQKTSRWHKPIVQE